MPPLPSAILPSVFDRQNEATFAALGLELEQFIVQNISLPDELQKPLDQRISTNTVGDLGRYAQFAAAESLPLAAANAGGAAGMGMGSAWAPSSPHPWRTTSPPRRSLRQPQRPSTPSLLPSAPIAANRSRRAPPSAHPADNTNDLPELRRSHAPGA